MNTKDYLRPALLAAACAFAMAPSLASAELVTTEDLVDKAAVDARRAEITALLAREDAQEKLAQFGIAPEEAAERVAGMSDAEVMQVAQQMENLPAGQARGGGVSVVVLLLLIIILILAV